MLIKFLYETLINSPESFIPMVLFYFLPFVLLLLISITVHEFSHGFVAYIFGDDTPKIAGRLSLNPFTHLDPVGTLMLFIIGIGWAKPVPINTSNIEGRTKKMFVALAGPISNFLLALLGSLLLFLFVSLLYNFHININQQQFELIRDFANLFISINLILGLFNLLPIPPLDGSHVLSWILPENIEQYYMKIAPYGLIILVILFYVVGLDFIFKTADFIRLQLFEILSKIFS